MEIPEITKRMDQLRDELDALRPIPEDRVNRLNQKLRLDWNYHSNSIEGNTLSASETKAFILHGITANGKPFRDYVEMRGHNEALKKLENIVHHELKITEKLIKEFHQIILVEPFASEAEITPGEYRNQPNYLYTVTRERIDFAPPQEVPKLMNELVNWLNNHIDPPKREKYDIHPLIIACAFHVRFMQIHPFDDGNGRMARILMNLILMLCGYVPAVIKQEKRNEYYSVLNLSSLEDLNPLAAFVGEECIQSLEMALKAAKGESIEEPIDLDKTLSLWKQGINADDKENEIKEKLTVNVVYTALNNWGYDFLRELAVTTSKFDEFYTDISHYIYLYLDDDFHITRAKKDIAFYNYKNLFTKKVRNTIVQNISLTFYGYFINFKIPGYKKTFNCNYSVEIKFNEVYYEIGLKYFDPDGKENKKTTFTRKLLHQPLSAEEIKEINKQWGETLYNHLEYNRRRWNGNDGK